MEILDNYTKAFIYYLLSTFFMFLFHSIIVSIILKHKNIPIKDIKVKFSETICLITTLTFSNIFLLEFTKLL